MSFEVRVSVQNNLLRKIRFAATFTLMASAALAIGLATGVYFESYLGPTGNGFATAAIGVIAALLGMGLSYLTISRFPLDPDQRQRAVMADFQQFEKNVKQDIFRELSERYSENIPLDFVKGQIQSRLDEGMVKAIDDALRQRLTEGAKWVDIISYIDDANARISLELNGPGGRAEGRASWLLRGAIAVGAIGCGFR